MMSVYGVFVLFMLQKLNNESLLYSCVYEKKNHKQKENENFLFTRILLNFILINLQEQPTNQQR